MYGGKRRGENTWRAQPSGCALWTRLSSAFHPEPMRSVAISCWKSGSKPVGWHWHPPRRASSRVGALPNEMPPSKGRDGQRPAT